MKVRQVMVHVAWLMCGVGSVTAYAFDETLEAFFPFQAGSRIVAAEVNALFDDLDRRLAAFELAMSVDMNGNVGVGRPAAGARLAIGTSDGASGGASGANVPAVRVVAERAGGTARIMLDTRSEAGGEEWNLYADGSSKELRLGTFGGSNAGEKLRIDEAGHVAIGDFIGATPGQRHALEVDGRVRAQEVTAGRLLIVPGGAEEPAAGDCHIDHAGSVHVQTTGTLWVCVDIGGADYRWRGIDAGVLHSAG
ncbi:MAG: hypothetical protein RMA76_31975 [Deltaproteobacteria bacterium]|jgi:hypothetical protein